jgi:hypothetical protein
LEIQVKNHVYRIEIPRMINCIFESSYLEEAPSRAILIYAWNEHDEGGWLCPTINEDGSTNDSRMEALAKVKH